MPDYPLSHGHMTALSFMNAATRHLLDDYLYQNSEKEILETARQWIATKDPLARRHFACALMEHYWQLGCGWQPESRLIARCIRLVTRKVQWRVLAAALLARAAHELPPGHDRGIALVLRSPHVKEPACVPVCVESN